MRRQNVVLVICVGNLSVQGRPERRIRGRCHQSHNYWVELLLISAGIDLLTPPTSGQLGEKYFCWWWLCLLYTSCARWELLDRVSQEGRESGSVTLISPLIFTLQVSSLVVIPRQSAHTWTPQSYSSVIQNTESSACKTKWQYILA